MPPLTTDDYVLGFSNHYKQWLNSGKNQTYVNSLMKRPDSHEYEYGSLLTRISVSDRDPTAERTHNAKRPTPSDAIIKAYILYRNKNPEERLQLTRNMASLTKPDSRWLLKTLKDMGVTTSTATSRSWFRKIADHVAHNITDPKVYVPLVVVIGLVYALYRLRHKRRTDKEKSQRIDELQEDLRSAEHQLRLAVGRAKNHKALPFVKAFKLSLPEELQDDLRSAEHRLQFAVGRAKDHKALLPLGKALELSLPVIQNEHPERARKMAGKISHGFP
jgi:hypothetical protein